MGGIVAEKGFDFQTRFAACYIPVWLVDPTFSQLFYEGTGDIDIRFRDRGKSSRIHIQVKDHEVAPAEFRAVVEHFQKLDRAMPDTYTRFDLACPSLASKLQPCETGLGRYRTAKPFYDDTPSALAPTKTELVERLRNVGLNDAQIEFVESKVYFDIGCGDLHHDDRAENVFVGRLLRHPEFADKIRAMVQPAFAELLRAIHSKKGAVFNRSDLEQTLRNAIASTTSGEKSITVWIQNWTREKFDVPADYSLDWSPLFDRASRRVPVSEIWNTKLLPELTSLKGTIAAERAERVIRLRGKCALSTSVALGMTFPSVGGWIFEIPQPPSTEAWRSDADATNPYELQVELANDVGTDLVLCVSISGDSREDVRRYVASTGVPPKLFVIMTPPVSGNQSIRGSGDAVAFALSARDKLKAILKNHRLTHTRLFFFGPAALAVFFGQQLTSIGEVQLFEYQDPDYVPTCLLKT